MGTNDTAEQLQAAQAECVRLEQQLARAEAVIEGVRVALIDHAFSGTDDIEWTELDPIADILATYPTSAALNEVKAGVLDEAAAICERIQNDDKFGGDGPGKGVVAAKIVLQLQAREYRNSKEAGQ